MAQGQDKLDYISDEEEYYPEDEGYSFFLETTAADTLKQLIDILSKCVGEDRAHFTLSEEGIFLVANGSSNDGVTTIIEIDLKEENFSQYFVRERMTISVPLDGLYRAFSSAKKKSTARFSIENDSTTLDVVILPDTFRSGKSLKQTSCISFENSVERMGIDMSKACRPLNISRDEFQTICKKISEGASAIIEMQETRYMLITSKIDSSYSFKFSKGKKNEKRPMFRGTFGSYIFKHLKKLHSLSPSFVSISYGNNLDYMKIGCQVGSLGRLNIYMSTIQT